MQAIILAAGMGKRLGDLTKDNTKCMIKVNGTYLIDRLLSQLDSLNLERIILVIGYQGEKLRTHIEKQSRNTPIEYIYNPVYNKTNNIYSLYLAKEELQKQDTLLIESDLIFEDTLFHKILNNPYPNLALVAKYEPWMDGTMVRLNTENDIIDFISKKTFRYADIDDYYKTVNIYKFSKEFLRNSYVPFLEAYSKALGNNEYYEQVLRVITLLERCELKGLPLEGERWYEIDDIQDLDIAETIFAEQDQLQRYQKRYGGYWRFPKLKDFCYLVNPYFPPQKMCEELQANFNVLLREYPSGMGVNTLVMAKKLRYPARLCGCWQRSRRNHQSADGTFRWQNGSNLSHFRRISQPAIRRNHCILSTECRFSLYGKRTDAFLCGQRYPPFTLDQSG